MGEFFRKFSQVASNAVGSPWAFLLALGAIIVWAITGPMFQYSDTWQLVINTGTTIITFLMVFLIQNTQNRDAKAIHLKLDELIYTKKKASNELINLEECSDEELETLQKRFEEIRKRQTQKGNQHASDKLGELSKHIEEVQRELH